MRRLSGIAVALVALVAGAPAAAAASSSGPDRPIAVDYVAPVDAPVTDAFRPPDSPYGAGNRGVDYATAPGQPVRTAAAGEVVFAGLVAGGRHVVVLHGDGLRTSYSFLADIAVLRGQRIAAGAIVGTAGDSLHFGVRAGDAYLDPLALLGGGVPTVRLVADDLRRPQSEGAERGRLASMLRGLGSAGKAALGGARSATVAGAQWARERAAKAMGQTVEPVRAWAHTIAALREPLPMSLAQGGLAWLARRRSCTPASAPAPPPPARHVAVLVGGLGSESGKAAVLDVPTAALGYAAGDVVQLSYRGGDAAHSRYGSADTQADIRQSARHLRGLLEQMAAQHPGVPVDLFAHSQGGLVVRAALAYELDAGDGRLPPMGTVITLGTPHKGADLATTGAMLEGTVGGRAALGAASLVKPAGIDPRSTSIRQMAETSRFIRHLNARPLPTGLRVVSIAARGDIVVPSPRSRLAGAANVVVDVPGAVADHDSLPGSPAAHREMALALAGLPPGCESLVDALTDVAVGQAIGKAEDAIGLGLSYVARPAPIPVPRR